MGHRLGMVLLGYWRYWCRSGATGAMCVKCRPGCRPSMVSLGCVLLAAVLLHGYSGADAQDSILSPITGATHQPFLFDRDGRVRLFHGLNFVQKGPPWYPEDLLDGKLAATMATWGVNVVRLGWMWSGFEPKPGVFDEVYFNTTRAIVNTLAQHGIYAILDMHQDALSSLFCSYDGIPQYIIDQCANKSRHVFPWPFQGNCSSRPWGSNELTEAEGVCYQSLYDNGTSRDALRDFWVESAGRWAANTNILGYELINEPFAGDIYNQPELLLPGEAGRRNLQPLYDYIVTELRQKDDQHLIFYEPVTWGMIFNNHVVGSGFTDVPGGAAYRNQSVLSYHYYCQSFSAKYNKVLCDDITGPQVMRAVAEDISRLGGSSFLTEFGSCDESGWLDECVKVMDFADAHLQSWTEWSGVPSSAVFIDALSRTYAMATAGMPINMTFSQVTKRFDLCFSVDTAIKEPTEIFASFSAHYPRGCEVTSTNALISQVDVSAGRIYIVSSAATVNGHASCVHVTAR